MNCVQDKLISKKISKVQKKFDSSIVKKITKIKFPEEVQGKIKKCFKLAVSFLDDKGKHHEKSIFFGDKNRYGCEFIHHKNEEIRDKYIKTLDKCATFFDKNFMNRWLLNGEKGSLVENWEILKNNYLTQ
jgi:hypothetical protein